MSIRSIRPVTGPWADESSFFGRDEELAKMVERIRAGASISLAAPRRVGKTSLLHAVERKLRDEMSCVFADLESSGCAEDAIREIAEKARTHPSLNRIVSDWIRAIGGQKEIKATTPNAEATAGLRELLQVDWQAQGASLITALTAHKRQVVLFLDELPVLVAGLLAAPPTALGRSPADVFLSWLRRMTQEHRGQLRVVVTGSIGLAPMVARAGLSATLNAYEHQRLNPWTRDTAVDALLGLSAYTQLDLAEDAAHRMVELLGIGVPFHVQLFHDAVAQDARRRKVMTVTAGDAERVWTEQMVNDPGGDLPHWEQRLRKALHPPEYAAAIRLLTEASRKEPLTLARAEKAIGSSENLNDLLLSLLDVLEHDGYLARGPKGWYFPNRLLHAWWTHRYLPLRKGSTR